MEYVFGTKGDAEILKVKSESHTDLTGYQTVKREYHGESVTDHFRVARKLDSKEDEANACYDWYEIDRHYRMVDRTNQEKRNAANIDYLSMMTGVDLLEEGGANEPEI